MNVVVTDTQHTPHLASSLSDGTLRFLALAVLKYAPDGQRLICLEEPENGIHPQRIRPILRLLRELAVDVEEEIGPTNPLRQVLINTHSPLVVEEVLEDELIVVMPSRLLGGGKVTHATRMVCVDGTWRAKVQEVISRGVLIRYLNSSDGEEDQPEAGLLPRIRDRLDFKDLPYAHGTDLP
jgi:ABC-type multidrug transport system ATPase subunit